MKPIIKFSQKKSMVSGIEDNGKVEQSQCCDSAIIHWWQNIIVDLNKGSFSWVKFPVQIDNDLMCLNYLCTCECRRLATTFSRTMNRKLKLDTGTFSTDPCWGWGWGRCFLVTSGAWRSMRELRILSYSSAGSVALVLGYLISSEFSISALKAAMLIAFNFRYVIVCGTVWLVCWNFQVCNNRKVVRNHIRCWYRENITPFRENHKIKSVTMIVGNLHIDLDQDSKIPVSCLLSRWWGIYANWLRCPIRARSWGSEAM